MDMEKMVVNHATWGRSRHLKQFLLKIRLKENWKNTQEITLIKFLYSKVNVIYKREDTIHRYKCLGEEERKVRDVNGYKLIETWSNVSTWGSLLESRSK